MSADTIRGAVEAYLSTVEGATAESIERESVRILATHRALLRYVYDAGYDDGRWDGERIATAHGRDGA